MTDHTTQSPTDADAIRRGRLKAAALFMVALGPMLVAVIMFYTGWGIPMTTTNNGDLMPAGSTVFDTGLGDAEGNTLEPLFLPDNEEAKWWVLVVDDHCGQACEDLLLLTRQVHISLNREAPRVQRAFYAANADEVPLDEHPRLSIWSPTSAQPITLPEGQQPADGPFAYVVDPMGNLVLRYDTSHIGRDMLDDIRHLLKLSPLG